MTTIRGDDRHAAVRQINQVLSLIRLNYTQTHVHAYVHAHIYKVFEAFKEFIQYRNTAA